MGSTLSLSVQTGGGICREDLKNVLTYLSCGCQQQTDSAGAHSRCWRVPEIPVCQVVFPDAQGATEEMSLRSRPDAGFWRSPFFHPSAVGGLGSWGEQQHPQKPGESRAQRGHIQPVTADVPLLVSQLETRPDTSTPPGRRYRAWGTRLGINADRLPAVGEPKITDGSGAPGRRGAAVCCSLTRSASR